MNLRISKRESANPFGLEPTTESLTRLRKASELVCGATSSKHKVTDQELRIIYIS